MRWWLVFVVLFIVLFFTAVTIEPFLGAYSYIAMPLLAAWGILRKPSLRKLFFRKPRQIVIKERRKNSLVAEAFLWVIVLTIIGILNNL